MAFKIAVDAKVSQLIKISKEHLDVKEVRDWTNISSLIVMDDDFKLISATKKLDLGYLSL